MLADLLAHDGVVEEMSLAGPMGVMALHGGLEKETAPIAREVAAATGASLYVVEQPGNLAWHIPSVRYRPEDSARLATFLGHVRTVVSIHGFGRDHLRTSVLVGGRNAELGGVVAAALRTGTGLRVVDDRDEIPAGLRGMHRHNPVNLAPEAGVQLELSHSARVAPHRAALVSTLSRVLGAQPTIAADVPQQS